MIFISIFWTNIYAQVNYFNNTYNYNDFSPALAVIEHDSNYIVYGVTNDSLYNSVSVYIASINGEGQLNYWKTISDSNTFYWAGYGGGGLVSCKNGGFVAAGCAQYTYRTNAILYRFDENGDTIWTKEYPDTVTNMRTQFWDCDTTKDGGYIMIGPHTVEAYYTNVLLIKADSLGKEQWRREYGEPGWIKHGYSVVQTPDKGFLIGYYEYIAGQDDTGDPVVMKVDSLGNFEWEQNLGGPTRDHIVKVCLGNDGSYFAGTSISDSVMQDNYYTKIKLYRLSTNGDIIWGKTYCQTELDNILYSINQDQDGGCIAVGKRDDYYNPQGQWWNEFGWLLKVNEDGDSIWYREYQYYNGTGDDYNDLYDVCLAAGGGYTMVGQARTWGTPQVAWVIKVDSIGCDTPGCGSVGVIEYTPSLVPRTPYLYIFPNPTKEDITIRYRIPGPGYRVLIYDLFGRKQDEMIISPGQEQTRIDVSAYPAGIYVAVLKNEDGVIARGKFIKSGDR